MANASTNSAHRLAGKVVLVTGADSGIGAATARLFCRESACVIATDINTDQLQLWAAGEPSVLALMHDVTQAESWDIVIRQALVKFGRIDVLVNCAGITGGGVAFEKVELTSFQHVLDVNLSGPFLGMQRVVPLMRDNGRGSIVNVASISGVIGNAGTSGYTASKGGLRALTKGAAIEFAAAGVRVNAIHPGYTQTAMTAGYVADEKTHAMMLSQTPLGRLGQPYDIAYAALYLASDESSFVTGGGFFIDGGMTAR
ncbi:3-alpha-(or 20-beta)-hydroxysteroid dehydrogenase [Pseudomonas sp. 9AZ]|uniref:SDR family NAD(P)-dependent oxidoreductase n=1 Tax=Pseudomonas sp. 9AZ TaxID=2653168 RepID=UPI0012F3889B|nr:glucose 1-dehydrogenase [Pseudomonas sp. 9AZ]VXD04467.1 3-alpha-(or 20-beta)-hydroxysteroid dehydrogenase [Pseudomonas sp. 9AZ]